VRSDNGDWADVHWLLQTILEQGSDTMKAEKEQGPKRRSFRQERLVKVTDESTGTQWTAEVGGGTVEVITGPCQNLHELKEKHENGVQTLLRAAHSMGPSQRVLGIGMQPFSPPTRELVIDRQRYLAMFEALGSDNWSWFAVTASDQIHIDAHRDELVVGLNAANAIAPIVAAVCGNSPVSSGKRAPHGAIAGRDAALLNLERYGFPDHLGFGPKHHWPLSSVEDWVQSASSLTYLLRPSEKQAGKSKSVELRPPPRSPPCRPFSDFVTGDGASLIKTEDDLWEEFKNHERYVWHAARPRWEQGTVEYRAACQQPHSTDQLDHMVPSALSLGCSESAEEIWELFSDTDVGGWPSLAYWYRAAIVNGLNGTGMGPTMQDGELLLVKVLRLIEDGLKKRGAGEEVYMEPVWTRVHAGENPGQILRSHYEATKRYDRAAALIEHAEVTV